MSGTQFVQAPRILLGQLIDDLGLAEVFWENFPSVGLHLQMLACRGMFCQPIESLDQVIGGALQAVTGFVMQWDVEVDAPLFTAIFA